MKKLKKIIVFTLFVGLSMALIYSCTRDIALQDAFDFTLTGTNENQVFIFGDAMTELKIETDSKVAYVNYSFFYQIIKGKGYLSDMNGNTILEKDTIHIKDFSKNQHQWEQLYTPESIGEHQIKIVAFDTHGLQKEFVLSYQVDYSPFTFLINKGSQTFTINAKNPIETTILNDNDSTNESAKIKESPYTLSYLIKNGTGHFEYENERIKQNDTVPIGTTRFSYVPTSLDTHTIEMTVTAPDGATITESIDVQVENSEFILETAANPTALFQTETSTIAIELTQASDNPLATYEAIVTSEMQIEVYDETGKKLTLGEYFPISLGSSSWTVQPLQTGSINLSVSIRDNSLNTKTEAINFNVAANDFELTAIPIKNSDFVNLPILVNLDVRELAENANDTFEVFGISNLNGYFQYQGSNYAFGQPFMIQAGINEILYFGEEQGTHQIVFNADSSSGERTSASATLLFKPVLFDYLASVNDNTMTIGETKDVSFVINETNGTSSYVQSFVLTQGAGILRDGNGQTIQQGALYPITLLDTYWTYEPTTAGTHSLQLIAQNKTGSQEDQIITIEVSEKDYTFAVIPSKTNPFVMESVSIAANISQSEPGGETFTLSYTTSGDGQLIYDDKLYSAGQLFNVPSGNFNMEYTGFEERNHTVQFFIESSSNLKKQQAVNLDFEYVDFNLNASTDNNPVLDGGSKNINFVINETSGNSSYQMRFNILSGNPTVRNQNNSIIDQGQWSDVPTGGFSWNVSSANAETVTLLFECENTTGLVQNENVSIVFEPFFEPFNLNVNVSNGIVLEDEPINMTALIQTTGQTRPNTSYEMTFEFDGVNTGFVTKSGQTYQSGDIIPVSIGNNNFSFTPTSNNRSEPNFIVSNSTAESHDDEVFLEIYKRPTLSNIRTATDRVNKRSCGNGCNWDYYHMIDFTFNTDGDNGDVKIKLKVRNKNPNDRRPKGVNDFDIKPAIQQTRDNYYVFDEDIFAPTGQSFQFDGENYEIYIIDSNNVSSKIYSGTFTDDKNDAQ